MSDSFHSDSRRGLREHFGWQAKHPLGPVTFDFACPICKQQVGEDVSLEQGQSALREHLQEHRRRELEQAVRAAQEGRLAQFQALVLAGDAVEME